MTIGNRYIGNSLHTLLACVILRINNSLQTRQAKIANEKWKVGTCKKIIVGYYYYSHEVYNMSSAVQTEMEQKCQDNGVKKKKN